MTLPVSGQISSDQIHVAAGGITGTEHSINDQHIRFLIGKAASTEMSFDEWYGADPLLATTMTAGFSSIVQRFTTSLSSGPFTYDSGTLYGYDAAAADGYFQDWTSGYWWLNVGDDGGYGSMTNTFTDHGANARTIVQLVEANSFLADKLFLSLAGTSIPNTDTTFVSMLLNGVELTRAAATYTASYNGSSHWSWDNPGALTSTGAKAVLII